MPEDRHSVRVFLREGRPDIPTPDPSTDADHYESIHSLLRSVWGDAPVTHALVRYSICSGLTLEEFRRELNGLKGIKRAFGKHVAILPVWLNAHDESIEDFNYLIDPSTGQYLIEIAYRDKVIEQGTYILLAVEADSSDADRTYCESKDAIDALETAVRFNLGANAVIKTRRTLFMDIESDEARDVERERFALYGPEQHTRSSPDDIAALAELATASDHLEPAVLRRLMLGMRWANIAFKDHDLIAFWTAIEIFSGARGNKAYPFIAEAFGQKRSRGQLLAREIGLEYAYKLRGLHAHEGIPVYLSVYAASFMFAVCHDLARHLAKLPSRQYAQSLLGGMNIAEEMKVANWSCSLDSVP